MKIPMKLLLILPLALTPIKGKNVVRDSVAPMKEKLAKLSAGQPKPLWQTALKAQETDFIRFLSNDRILVGTLETAGFILGLRRGIGWGLEPRDLILLNAANGGEVWTSSRAAFGYPQQLLSTDPVILIEGSTKCAALNPQNGALIWQRAWKRTLLGGGTLLLPGGERLVLFSEQKSSVALTAVNVKDGSQAWSASLDNYPREKEMVIEAKTAGDTLLLVGPEVAAFSVGSGKTLWRKPFHGAFGPAATAIVLGDDLYFTDGASITRSDPASGNDIWRQEFPGNTLQNLSLEGTSVFAVLREGGSDGSRDAIQALDRDAGKPLWRCDLAGQAQSSIAIQDGRIYVATASQLIAIDAAKGGLVLKGEIPPSLQTRRVLPDILRVTEDRILVARETGILAVRRRDGSLLYAEPVAQTAPFTSDYTMHKLNFALESITPLKKREAFHALNLESFLQAQRRAALAEQQAARQLSEARRRSQTAFDNFIGVGNTYGTTEMQRWGDLEGSSLGSAQAAIRELRSGYQDGRTGIMTAEISQAFKSHANSLQSNVYIRPRYEAGRGWSLVLVDLNTGKRAEVLLSPDNDPLGRSAPNLPAFDVDPSGSRIVAKGLGLDPARFETYEKRSFTPRQGGSSITVGRSAVEWGEDWSVPYPSVLAFDLAMLPFGQESESRSPLAKPVPAEKKQVNDRLIDAAFQCDLTAVKRMLDAGADVNAVNGYGQTALMLAVESLRTYDKEDVVETLLKRGADTSISDPYGWTAADYFPVAQSMFPYTYTGGGAKRGLKLLVRDGSEKEQ